MCKSYCKCVVIWDVNIEFNCGEVVVFLGLNGSGKIMFFYVIVGLVMFEGGFVMIDGYDVLCLFMYCCVKMGIGYLF